MAYEVIWTIDARADLHYPRVEGSDRPSHVLVEHYGVAGEDFLDAETLERNYVPMEGNDLWIPRQQAFIAYGGDLIYDVALVVGFDGVRSPLLEVRYSLRPDLNQPLTSTLTRQVHLDPLLRRAISENRTAFRRTSDTGVFWVSPQERQAVYLPAIAKASGASRRYVTDHDLKRVAKVYRRAIGDRRSPTKEVEVELGLGSRDVAKKRVQMARAAGYLPPAPGERRGGTA